MEVNSSSLDTLTFICHSEYVINKEVQDQEFPLDLLGVEGTHGPDYPLYEFKGFGFDK